MIGKRYLRETHFLCDALQESFIAIFRNLRTYDINKSGFKTWSGRIMINNCLKFNERISKSTVELQIEVHEQRLEPTAIEKMDEQALLQWLQKMPYQYYEIFSLHVVDGFSHDEIAKMIGVSSALSRKRLSRARAWIKKNTKNDENTSTNFRHLISML